MSEGDTETEPHRLIGVSQLAKHLNDAISQKRLVGAQE